MRMPDHQIINVNNRYTLDSDEDGEIYTNCDLEGSDLSSQRWDLIADVQPSNAVRIMNRQEKKFLGLRPDSATDVCLLNDDPADPSQKWILCRVSDGLRDNYYELENLLRKDSHNEYSLLEVPEAKLQAGSRVGVYKHVNSDHQRWQLSPSQASRNLQASLTGRWKTLRPQNSNVIPGIMYAIQDNSAQEGGVVIQWAGESHPQSVFKFTPFEEEGHSWHGFYRILARHTEKALTATATRIKQYHTGADQDRQLWRVEQPICTVDYYVIINKATDQPIESTAPNQTSYFTPVLGAKHDYKSVKINAGQMLSIIDAMRQ
jgi:hypothetical protein